MITIKVTVITYTQYCVKKLWSPYVDNVVQSCV